VSAAALASAPQDDAERAGELAGGLVLGPDGLRGPAEGERAIVWQSGLAGRCLAGLARCHGPKGPFSFLCFFSFLEFFHLSRLHFYLTQGSYMCILKCQVRTPPQGWSIRGLGC
jgi:hypothetical protein